MLSLEDVQFTYVVYALDQWARVKKGPLVFRFLINTAVFVRLGFPHSWMDLPAWFRNKDESNGIA